MIVPFGTIISSRLYLFIGSHDEDIGDPACDRRGDLMDVRAKCNDLAAIDFETWSECLSSVCLCPAPSRSSSVILGLIVSPLREIANQGRPALKDRCLLTSAPLILSLNTDPFSYDSNLPPFDLTKTSFILSSFD